MNRLKLNEMRSRMTQRLIHLVDAELTTIKHFRAQIRALSPAATLERGYAIVSDSSGKIVRDESQVVEGDEVLIRVNIGEFFANRTKPKKRSPTIKES
jgi:exodeoxyribonuclease VII large subunit